MTVIRNFEPENRGLHAVAVKKCVDFVDKPVHEVSLYHAHKNTSNPILSLDAHFGPCIMAHQHRDQAMTIAHAIIAEHRREQDIAAADQVRLAHIRLILELHLGRALVECATLVNNMRIVDAEELSAALRRQFDPETGVVTDLMSDALTKYVQELEEI